MVAKQQVRACINTSQTKGYGTIYKGDVVYVFDYRCNGCLRDKPSSSTARAAAEKAREPMPRPKP